MLYVGFVQFCPQTLFPFFNIFQQKVKNLKKGLHAGLPEPSAPNKLPASV